MSIFNYDQTLQDIKEGKTSLSLFCLACTKQMAVTNYQSFGCQHCQAHYTFESYNLQFCSKFMKILIDGVKGSGGAETPKTVTVNQTVNQSPPTTFLPEKTTIPQQQEKPEITLENMFDHVYSFDDIKRLIRIVLKSERGLHCLITGPPGQGKTVFLDAVKALYPEESEYLDSTMLSKAGLGSFLKKNPKLKILLLDELDKLPNDQQMILLNLLQKGLLRIEKFNKSTEMKFKDLKVIATGNDVEKIYYAVRNRFQHIHMDTYAKDEFYFIAQRILTKKYKFKSDFSKAMIDKFYDSIQNPSIRGIEQIAQALEVEGQTIENLDYHINMNSKYDSPT